MSTTRCSGCGNYHWPYAGAPFRPFCSEPCWAKRRKNAGRATSLSVEQAHDVLTEIRAHNLAVHVSNSITAWFDDCRACEILQERYAAALHEAA